MSENLELALFTYQTLGVVKIGTDIASERKCSGDSYCPSPMDFKCKKQ